jgi:archaellum component FlaC
MTKSNTERTLETLVDFADVHRQQMRDMGEHFDSSMNRVTDSIDALTHQIVTFTERLTRLEIQVERIADTAQAQNETARLQAESISQLIALLQTK